MGNLCIFRCNVFALMWLNANTNQSFIFLSIILLSVYCSNIGKSSIYQQQPIICVLFSLGEECKRDDLYSYHCEGFCNGSLTVLCDECCKLNGTWRCVVSTRYHQCETSPRYEIKLKKEYLNKNLNYK